MYLLGHVSLATLSPLYKRGDKTSWVVFLELMVFFRKFGLKPFSKNAQIYFVLLFVRFQNTTTSALSQPYRVFSCKGVPFYALFGVLVTFEQEIVTCALKKIKKKRKKALDAPYKNMLSLLGIVIRLLI